MHVDHTCSTSPPLPPTHTPTSPACKMANDCQFCLVILTQPITYTAFTPIIHSLCKRRQLSQLMPYIHFTCLKTSAVSSRVSGLLTLSVLCKWLFFMHWQPTREHLGWVVSVLLQLAFLKESNPNFLRGKLKKKKKKLYTWAITSLNHLRNKSGKLNQDEKEAKTYTQKKKSGSFPHFSLTSNEWRWWVNTKLSDMDGIKKKNIRITEMVTCHYHNSEEDNKLYKLSSSSSSS